MVKMCRVTPIVKSGKSIVSDSGLGKRDNINTIWEIDISFCSTNSYKMIKILPGNKAKVARRIWRYQRGNQNPYIEEDKTTQ